jgi:hypothetical protein
MAFICPSNFLTDPLLWKAVVHHCYAHRNDSAGRMKWVNASKSLLTTLAIDIDQAALKVKRTAIDHAMAYFDETNAWTHEDTVTDNT